MVTKVTWGSHTAQGWVLLQRAPLTLIQSQKEVHIWTISTSLHYIRLCLLLDIDNMYTLRNMSFTWQLTLSKITICYNDRLLHTYHILGLDSLYFYSCALLLWTGNKHAQGSHLLNSLPCASYSICRLPFSKVRSAKTWLYTINLRPNNGTLGKGLF